ncbi:HAD family hydrolase [Paracoccaceae bacterium GXU_MW_L88]
MAPEAVIFDIGRVLIDWQPDRVYAPLMGEDRHEFYARTGIFAANERVDAGADMGEVLHDLAADHPDDAAEIMLWGDRWDEMVGPEIEGSVAILHDLKAKGVPVHALSNFGKDTFAAAQKRFGALQHFDLKFISGSLGMIKPDPAIFAYVEDALGLKGSQLFFTDDSEKNIAAAKARGWQTHLFTEPDGLRAALSPLLTA